MFDNCSIFVIIGSKDDCKVRKLETSRSTQKELNNRFGLLTENLLKDKCFEYSSDYHLEEDEVFKIEKYELNKDIENAICSQLDINSFNIKEFKTMDIRAIFTGQKDKDGITIVFQLVKKDQHLSPNKPALLMDGNTFKIKSQNGITVDDNVDCVYHNGTLLFKSFYNAKLILDLSAYQTIANDEEVELFLKNTKIVFSGNINSFKSSAPTWVRKRIAAINKSNVLKDYEPLTIKHKAKNCGIDIKVSKGKIVLPEDKNDLKNVLGFLDEGVYTGTFSNNVYLSNSKREIGGSKKK